MTREEEKLNFDVNQKLVFGIANNQSNEEKECPVCHGDCEVQDPNPPSGYEGCYIECDRCDGHGYIQE
jgi:DnaJ-class molecular chaperone